MPNKILTRQRVISILDYTITGLDALSQFSPSLELSAAILVLSVIYLLLIWLERE